LQTLDSTQVFIGATKILGFFEHGSRPFLG
jgi:hypothetical protein